MVCDLFVGIDETCVKQSLGTCRDSRRVFKFISLWVEYEDVLRCNFGGFPRLAANYSIVVGLAADMNGVSAVAMGKELLEFFVLLAENFFRLIGCEG